MDRLIIWFWHRFMPREGWLLFTLLASILALSVQAVVAADWLPDLNIVWASAVTAFCVAYTFVWRQQVRTIWHWGLIVSYLLTIPTLVMIGFRPFTILTQGWTAYQLNSERNWSVFWARVSGWINTITAGGESRETIVFAWSLGLIVGLCVAFAVWSVYRHKQPFLIIFVLLLLVGLNNFFTGSTNGSILFIILLGVIFFAMWRQQNHELYWDSAQIDYATDMRVTNLAITAAIAFVLLFSSLFLPAIPFSNVARWFARTNFAQAFDATFEQYFAGVNTAANRPSGSGAGAGGPPVVGVMPRSYLLGNPPELAETPIFLAEVAFDQPFVGPQHWRSASFDIYTGRGWRRSGSLEVVPFETQAEIPQLIPVGQDELNVEISQTVSWFADGRSANLLTIGTPLTFDHPVSAHFRLGNDLSYVQNFENVIQPSYSATSSLVNRNSGTLNQVEISPEQFENILFYERYTALPESVPERVLTLAEQITAEAQTPFEQALLLEQYLRQYPYNLDIGPVPADADPVDYFLFDLQEGYCDLYASSMVVMARSLGLPARLGIGYLNPQPRADGKYMVTQNLGHSWAEIYFPEVGWVEFEPTAGFPTSSNNDSVAQGGASGSVDPNLPELPGDLPLPIPDAPPANSFPWPLVLIAAVILALAVPLSTRLQRRREPKTIHDVYGKLVQHAVHFGYPADASETVSEFDTGLQEFVGRWIQAQQIKVDRVGLIQNIGRMLTLYEQHLYSPAGLSDQDETRSIDLWRASSRPMRKLSWIKRRQNFVNYFFK
ncbi:MAG: transglutaminase-like domain-containing protein [Chloroflexota bacterium]